MSNFYCGFFIMSLLMKLQGVYGFARRNQLSASLFATLVFSSLQAANQTATLSPILPEDSLPFTIEIEEDAFTLPAGLHSGASANYKGIWVFIAGRTNGLHGFGAEEPFPPDKQNVIAYAIDLANQKAYSRSLNDPTSGLTQQQIDDLSVTSPQSFQMGKTLYICGGYGIDTETGLFGTKQTLTAIDLSKFIRWIQNGNKSASRAIRQTSHPWMQVTGGIMALVNNHRQGLLFFGQNFTGVYTDSSNGDYTRQVRRFQIIDNGKKLSVQPRATSDPDPSYRRRDLNVVPIIKDGKPAFFASSGVFTLTGGIWTVPIIIDNRGKAMMADPDAPNTFKQGMNNYVSATAQLYSKSFKSNYIILLGGLSYGYFNAGTFETDSEVPFINQITTVKIDKDCQFSQYLMDNEYPVILSQGTNPGNRLIFGAGAYYFNSGEVSEFSNNVVDLDKVRGKTVIGYIVGGIMSTVSNTSSKADSTASPYIFKVVLTPRN